jgi:hypothetical protein
MIWVARASTLFGQYPEKTRKKRARELDKRSECLNLNSSLWYEEPKVR